MEVSEIYTYPIKSLRGISLKETILTKHGLPYDRRFILCRIIEDAPSPSEWKLKNMQVGNIPEMVLFSTELVFPDPSDPDSGHVVVTYNPPDSEKTKSIEIPLSPSTEDLSTVTINLYGSTQTGYCMPSEYNSWFTACFNYPVILVHAGPSRRQILASNPAKPLPPTSTGYLSSVTSLFTRAAPTPTPDEIWFQDITPYLIVSQASCDALSARLPVPVDITKFRPNIVIRGAPEAWEEDFWATSTLGDARIINAHNCGRCQSINVDYETGKYDNGEKAVLKRMGRERRVDTGHKWSPVFGRYSYLDERDDGIVLRVGDPVEVTKRNEGHTTFDWDLGT